MIQNIVLLLVASTLAPYLMLPPVLLSPLPVVQVLLETPSTLQSMNLTRVHSHEQFRVAFKASLRVHHPDHGGSQEVFQQIQGLKKIMSREINYYDLYNLTDADISSTGRKLQETILIKQYAYYVETGIFYFITFLYILAFTLDAQAKTPRSLMLALTVAFAAYELYMHEYPQSLTLIDLLYNKLPLFTQRKFMKRALVLWIALIRVHYDRKQTEEQTLLAGLKQDRPAEEYRDMLQRLKAINSGKLEEKKKYEKSWGYKIRNWVSKGVSLIFLLLLVKSLIPGLSF